MDMKYFITDLEKYYELRKVRIIDPYKVLRQGPHEIQSKLKTWTYTLKGQIQNPI